VGGGELFDFIAETGKFSEKVTRTYFHQMMNGLHYMHSKGMLIVISNLKIFFLGEILL
jgi:serine/threonine protein kinase